ERVRASIALETKMRAFLPLLIFVVACDGSSTSTSDATAACNCKALNVSFDKASSGLGAANVQDAIDELAARPLPEPAVGGRIQTIIKAFPNPGTHGGITLTADCADTAHDVALGGACGFDFGGTIVETRVTNDETHASYTCGWDQPTGGTQNVSVTVVCLTKA